ncbi:MAG TPA: tetratricopeptide repeat protein [Pyrinomonadaceae bacterium]|nr:tetratricopeptide repeat protein [Pyrinomonadaceae bacterium]
MVTVIIRSRTLARLSSLLEYGPRPPSRAPYILAACLLAWSACSPSVSAQRRSNARTRASSPAPPAQAVEQLMAEATQAREAGRVDEAIEIYRKVVSARPKWDEGWWYLATLLYDRDRYREAASAFKEATRLQPKIGATWVMLGLCEFQLELYEEALQHLRQGRQFGIINNKELSRVARYHEALLMLRRGDFEAAQQALAKQAQEGVNKDELVMALGLAVMRMPLLPKSVTATNRDRELIRRIGWAEHQFAQKNLSDAQREYERVVADYAKTPGVQYGYGRFLIANQNEEGAVAAFRREIETSPNHAMAHLQIAYIKLLSNDAAAGLPYAEQGVRLHPQLALGYYLLGRLQFDTGKYQHAIEALETARRLAPDEPKIHFSLAHAYIRVNRKADAGRARAEFTRLNKLIEEAAGDGTQRGEAIRETDTGGPTKP